MKQGKPLRCTGRNTFDNEKAHRRRAGIRKINPEEDGFMKMKIRKMTALVLALCLVPVFASGDTTVRIFPSMKTEIYNNAKLLQVAGKLDILDNREAFSKLFKDAGKLENSAERKFVMPNIWTPASKKLKLIKEIILLKYYLLHTEQVCR